MDLVQDFIGVKNEVERARTKEHIPGAGDAMATFLTLSGLRGHWPMSSVDENGGAGDLSSWNRTLTKNGSLVYGWDGLAPYVKFNSATSDYLSRADEAGLRILGTESYIENPGLTLGGWFKTSGAALESLMSKYNGAGQLSYLLRAETNNLSLYVSVDGTASVSVTDFGRVSAGVWHCLAGVFVPSGSLTAYVDKDYTINTTGIPASIFNSNAALQISGWAGTTHLLTGMASNCFLCVGALDRTLVLNYYEQTRNLYGV